MSTDPPSLSVEERAARLRAMVAEGLTSGPATVDTQKDQDELKAIARGTPSLVAQLSMPEASGIEFGPPKARFNSPPADLSDTLAHMPDVGRDDVARPREQAEFVAHGEGAWQDHQRKGQSRPAGADFDRIHERIDARRKQWFSENKSALESSNRYVIERGLPLRDGKVSASRAERPTFDIDPARDPSFAVEGVLVELLHGLGLAHIRADDGSVYGLNRNTPGVAFHLLEKGQRWRCEVTERFHRVLRAKMVT